MRLFLKFSAVALVALCCQLLIEAGMDPLDEAQFTVRVYIAHLGGEPIDSPEMLDMGARMIERQIARERHRQRRSAPQATSPVVCAASAGAADDLDW
jgi:hypothetical protein